MSAFSGLSNQEAVASSGTQRPVASLPQYTSAQGPCSLEVLPGPRPWLPWLERPMKPASGEPTGCDTGGADPSRDGVVGVTAAPAAAFFHVMPPWSHNSIDVDTIALPLATSGSCTRPCRSMCHVEINPYQPLDRLGQSISAFMPCRYFTCLNTNETAQRYTGESPKSTDIRSDISRHQI